MRNSKFKIRNSKFVIRTSYYQLLITLIGVIALLAILSATPALAQGPNLDDQVNRIARNLYCPVCPNTPLDVCDTQACVQWRALIKEKLSKGESEQQIHDYFVAQYGERVLGAPTARGFNWLAYILPALIVIAGGCVAGVTVRGWLAARAAADSAQSEEPAISQEYVERVEKELKEI